MENIEYICELIIEKDNQIYFDDEEHFENFLKLPKDVEYSKKDFEEKNNILFYLAYEKYDLMEKVIDYGLFDKIDINQLICFYEEDNTHYLNILMFSCMFSNEFSSNKIVKILLKHPKININSQDENGYTALLISVTNLTNSMTKETTEILLSHPNIDINICDNEKLTVLMSAVVYSSDEIVEILLKHPNININKRDSDGRTALLIAISSYHDFYTITKETIKLLVKHSDINVNLYDKKGSTPLLKALDYPSLKDVAKLLIKHPNININLQDHKCSTPLVKEIICSEGNVTEILELMLEKPNINVNASIYCYYKPIPLLAHVITKSWNEIAKRLIKHPNIDIIKNGSISLFNAIDCSNNKCIKMLLKHPDIDANVKNNYGITAFIHTILKSKGRINKSIKIFLNSPKTNIFLGTTDGFTLYDVLKLFPELRLFGYIKKYNMFYLQNQLNQLIKLNESSLPIEPYLVFKRKKFYRKHYGLTLNFFEEKQDEKSDEKLLKDFLNNQKFHMIKHRRYYRKNILKRYY
jgi:ankyrin repeat protein